MCKFALTSFKTAKFDVSTPPPARRNLPLQQGYTGKVYSLLLSEFRHVLMVDADSMPTQVRNRVSFR